MKREFATTWSEVPFIDGDPEFPQPTEPSGDGWELRGVAVREGRFLCLVWAWQRDIPDGT